MKNMMYVIKYYNTPSMSRHLNSDNRIKIYDTTSIPVIRIVDPLKEVMNENNL